MKHIDIQAFHRTIAEQLAAIYQDPILCDQCAWWLLQAITGKPKTKLVTAPQVILSAEQEAQLNACLDKLINEHMPLQYLLGSVPFCDLEILVKPPVLIPRPETEEWCANLIEQLTQLTNKNIMILDLCTGSGCIALALAKALPEAQVHATDISDEALELARANTQHNNITNVTFEHSDVYQAIPVGTQFDLIVSNPPYIARQDWALLEPSVTQWEDQQALIAQDEGLAIIKRIVQKARGYLKQNAEFKKLSVPSLVIEIGFDQGDKVDKLMGVAQFKNVVIHKDMAGKDRVVTGSI